MTSDLIGMLRHRVSIERPDRTDADGGGASISWLHIVSVFARVEAVNGREIEIADGIAGRITHKVKIRYRADVAPQMRFVIDGRPLDIRAALDLDGRRRWLDCLCEEQRP